jgi:hypothetical protein
MQKLTVVRPICVLFLTLGFGCTVQDPLPLEPTASDSPLTEQEIREIAAEVAEDVAVRVQQEAKSLADEEQQRRTKATDEQSRLAQEAAAVSQEQAIIDAVNRSEEAYWLLVPSERMRVDAIREQLSKIGLTRLDYLEIQWAWHGDGQDCLRAEFLVAASKAQGELEADTASLGLKDAELIEFFCLDPLEQLRRLHLAKRLVAGDASIEEETIIEFRRDPFLGKLVTEYMQAQRKLPR